MKKLIFETYTAFRGKGIIKDEYKELVELINTGSWEEENPKFISDFRRIALENQIILVEFFQREI